MSRASLIALVRPRRAPSGRCVRSTVTRRRLRPASASRSGSDRRQPRVTGVWRRPDRPPEDVEPPMEDSLASTPGERPHGDRATLAGSGTAGPRALQARRVGVARCALFPSAPGADRSFACATDKDPRPPSAKSWGGGAIASSRGSPWTQTQERQTIAHQERHRCRNERPRQGTLGTAGEQDIARADFSPHRRRRRASEARLAELAKAERQSRAAVAAARAAAEA